MKRSLILLALIVIATNAFAQPAATTTPAPVKPQEQLDAMAKLEYMLGRWTGSGWADMNGTKMPVRETVVIEPKVGGAAMMIQNDVYDRPQTAGGDTPSMQMIGVVSYDPKAKAYHLNTWLSNGMGGDHDFSLTPNGFIWTVKRPGETMRYTNTMTPQGDWLEKGERSTDGTTWKQVFEMKLSREL